MNNDLTYQIYLDVPMMTNFLASIQGGYIEEAETSTTDSNSTRDDIKKNKGIGFNKILRGNIGKTTSNEITEQLESHYKTNVKFPQSLLFKNLRNELTQNKQIKNVCNKDNIKKIDVGDIIEFNGIAFPDPSFVIQSFFQQLTPIIEPYYRVQITQNKQLSEMVKKASNNKPIPQNDGTRIDGTNKKEVLKNIEIANEQLNNEFDQVKMISSLMDSLLHNSSEVSNIIFESDNFKIVGKVHIDYSRHKSLNDIYYGNWRVLAKVIGKISQTSPYDLLKNSPLALFNRKDKENFFKSLKSEDIQFPKVESEIKEDSLVIVPIAIFQ